MINFIGTGPLEWLGLFFLPVYFIGIPLNIYMIYTRVQVEEFERYLKNYEQGMVHKHRRMGVLEVLSRALHGEWFYGEFKT